MLGKWQPLVVWSQIVFIIINLLNEYVCNIWVNGRQSPAHDGWSAMRQLRRANNWESRDKRPIAFTGLNICYVPSQSRHVPNRLDRLLQVRVTRHVRLPRLSVFAVDSPAIAPLCIDEVTILKLLVIIGRRRFPIKLNSLLLLLPMWLE